MNHVGELAIIGTVGTEEAKSDTVNNFLSFYSVILKLGTKKELVVL